MTTGNFQPPPADNDVLRQLDPDLTLARAGELFAELYEQRRYSDLRALMDAMDRAQSLARAAPSGTGSSGTPPDSLSERTRRTRLRSERAAGRLRRATARAKALTATFLAQ